MMQINNPFQMNDWDIGKFLKVILAIQLAMLGTIGLDTIGLHIPILRQLIGFVYLTFVPGILILRILKLHKLGNIETLLYTVGLSIATLMFTGLFMNTVYPLFGISGPISITPLIITISAVVLILCVLSYIRDKDFFDTNYINVKDVLSPPALFLCLIPFLAIFGTYLVNFHHSNILLMFLILIIALIAVLIGFDKFIPKNLYPLAVFVIAISLLFHRTLISMYVVGWDIHQEYYLSMLVMENSYWTSTIPSSVNAMLSIVMLAPIYSIVSNMGITWVLKISYPLLFSLAPLGLYHVFKKQTNDKIAFLSCFFFMSVFRFFFFAPRQNIAELFLILMISVMIDKDTDKKKRAFLFIVFGVSLAVSHYGTSYIFMFCLITAWFLLFLMDNPAIQRLRTDFYVKIRRYKNERLAKNPYSLKKEDRTISSTFVLLFITFTLAWYMYVSSFSAFNVIVHIGDHIANTIFTDFLNPTYAQGLDVIISKETPTREVTKYLHLISQFFILVGVITLLLKRKEMKFEREYEAFSLANLAICFSAIALPHFASALNTERLYHITLIFLAPFCIIGGLTFFRMMSKVVRVSWTYQRVRSSLKVLSAFLAIFLLFNTGWVCEIAKDQPLSIALSQESVCRDAKRKANFYSCFVPEQDVFSAMWLSKNTNKQNLRIYSDRNAKWHVLRSYGMMRENITMLSSNTKIQKNAYIYLRRLNIADGIMGGPIYNTTEIIPILGKSVEIYSNGGSEIYYSG